MESDDSCKSDTYLVCKNQILKIFLALIIFCTSPLLPLYGLALHALREFTCLCARIFRPDLEGCVKSASVLLAQEDIWTKPKYNLVVILAFDGLIELEALRSTFQERIVQKSKELNVCQQLLYPQLRQYWTSYLNYLFWKQDEDFAIENHVRRYDYSSTDDNNGNLHFLNILRADDGSCNENSVREIMGGLLAKPWRVNRSCWEMLLVDNYKSVELPGKTSPSSSSLESVSESESGTLLIFRMHHGMGDGYSILKLLMRDLIQEDPGIQLNSPDIKIWEKVKLYLLLPFTIPWSLAGIVLDSSDGENCWHYLDRELSREYYTNISKPIDVQLIKRIKNKYQVSYHAVLCTAVAGGSRRVMEDAGQEVPRQLTCLTPVPVLNHPEGMSNHLSAAYMKWPLEKFYTRERRLQLISDSIGKSKPYSVQLAFRFCTKITTWAPNFISRVACKVPCTVILSNFPGPAVDGQKLLGATYKDIIAGAGCGPGQVGATMMLVSSNGKQRCVTSIDKSVFPSQHIFQKLDDYIEEELWALMESRDSINQKSDTNYSSHISNRCEINSKKLV